MLSFFIKRRTFVSVFAPPPALNDSSPVAPVARPPKKVPKSESSLAQTNEGLDFAVSDQKRSEGPDSEHNNLQPLSEALISERNKGQQPFRQQELAFENVFVDEAEVSDKNAELSESILRPKMTGKGAVATPMLGARATEDPVEPITSTGPKKSTTPVKRPQILVGADQRSYELGFGDLLNLGLSGDFIKKEFSIEEFDGGISKAELLQRIIDTFYEPLEKAAFEKHSNLVFLGTPGSGKSTICAKLMHYYGTQYSDKPSVVHVTPEKLFEADRLNFHARMFNFSFKRHHVLDNDALCLAKRQLIEVSWDFQIPFANYYARNSYLHASVKPFLVLPAEMNTNTLEQVLRVFPKIKSIILSKCDYGRFSVKNLMILYQNGCKISVLSGDRVVSGALEIVDGAMMREFVEYTLRM